MKCIQEWRRTGSAVNRNSFFACGQCGFKYNLARTKILGVSTSPCEFTVCVSFGGYADHRMHIQGSLARLLSSYFSSSYSPLPALFPSLHPIWLIPQFQRLAPPLYWTTAAVRGGIVRSASPAKSSARRCMLSLKFQRHRRCSTHNGQKMRCTWKIRLLGFVSGRKILLRGDDSRRRSHTIQRRRNVRDGVPTGEIPEHRWRITRKLRYGCALPGNSCSDCHLWAYYLSSSTFQETL